MKKVSVFTVLTCFLAGTASFPCYAGGVFGKPDEPVDDGRKGLQAQPSTSIGRGAGRGSGSGPAQPPAPVGRGAGRGSISAQPPAPVGRGADQNRRSPVHSKQKSSADFDLPDFPGTFDDVSSGSNAPKPMTAAEAAMVEQLIKDGKLPGINLNSASSHQAVHSIHGPVGGERVEQLSTSTMPSPNPAPAPLTIAPSLVTGEETKEAGVPSPSPASSSVAIDDKKIKDDNALSLFIPRGATITEAPNCRLTKVPMVCVLTEWDYIAGAGKDPTIRRLYEQEAELDIAKLKNGVAWAKHWLTFHGKAQQKLDSAKMFGELIEARMNGLIEEVKESLESKEEPSVFIRFLHDKSKSKIFFSIERSLGKVILVEIPGQEL